MYPFIYISSIQSFIHSVIHLFIHAFSYSCCRSFIHSFIKSPPTMWWWRLIVFAESARRRHWFQLSLENPHWDYFRIFAVCILALGNFPGNFVFFAFSSFFNKIQDGRQNHMAHARAWTASSICFMFGLKYRPYPGRELKSFWSDFDNKNFDFFTFYYFSGYFCFAHFGHHQNLIIWSHHPKWAEIKGGWLLTRESLPKLLL